MPNKATITVNPADYKRLQDKIKALQKMDVNVDRFLNAEAERAVDKMRIDAPKDTGRLKNNIEAQRTILNTYEITSEAIDPDTGIDYAPIQEFGGTNIKFTPYFFKNIRLFRNRVRNGINEIWSNLIQLKRVR